MNEPGCEKPQKHTGKAPSCNVLHVGPPAMHVVLHRERLVHRLIHSPPTTRSGGGMKQWQYTCVAITCASKSPCSCCKRIFEFLCISNRHKKVKIKKMMNPVFFSEQNINTGSSKKSKIGFPFENILISNRHFFAFFVFFLLFSIFFKM